MRKIFGIVLIGIGLFGIAIAILLPTVVVSGSSKTPLNLNITQKSSGSAKLLNASTGKVEDVQLRATRHVRTDSHASNGTNTTVIETLCIVIVRGKTPNCLPSSDSRLLQITTDRVTANRRTAQAVHVAKYNENVNGTSVRHSGLSYKFPIPTKKKTYQFYLPDVQKAFPAVYQSTTTISGLKVYKFVSRSGSQPYKILNTLPGTLQDTRTVYVEPQTGAIIDGSEKQTQTLSNGQVALATTLNFDGSAIKYQSNYARDKIDQLNTAKVKGPVIAGVVGLLALAGGVFLLLRGRRRGDDASGTHGAPANAPDGGHHDGPQHGGPQHGGPQHGGPQHGGSPGGGYPAGGGEPTYA